MDIEGKPFIPEIKKSFTVARLLVILTRFLFNLPDLPEKPDLFDEESNERRLKGSGCLLKTQIYSSGRP